MMDFTNGSNSTDNEINDAKTIAVGLYISIGVLGTVVNGLAIATIIFGKSISKESSLQILNLAAADFLSAILYPTMMVMFTLGIPFHAGMAACKAWMYMNTVIFYASPLWNVAISIEKFMAVYFPFRMLTYRKRDKIFVAVVVWLVAGVGQLDVALYSTLVERQGTSICKIVNPLKQTNLHLYDSVIALRFVLPATIIVTMYGLIGIKIFLRQKIGDLPQGRNSQVSNEKIKVLRMLAIDAFVTITTWLVFIYPAVSTDEYRERVGKKLVETVELFLNGIYMSNCCTTPIIYYMFNNSFKKDTKTLLKQWCCPCIKLRSKRRSTRTEYTFASASTNARHSTATPLAATYSFPSSYS